MGWSLLFRTTQDTILFVFVVDTFILGCRASRPEVRIDVEIEHQHLAIVLYNGGIVSRGKVELFFIRLRRLLICGKRRKHDKYICYTVT